MRGSEGTIYIKYQWDKIQYVVFLLNEKEAGNLKKTVIV